MRLFGPTTVLLAACGGGALPPPPPGPAALTASVQQKQVPTGGPVTLTVQVALADGWSLELPDPVVEGLTVERVGEPHSRRLGDRDAQDLSFALTGEDGSYLIDIPEVVASGPAGESLPLDPEPLFVDIGAAGPSSEVTDFVSTPPPEPVPWAWIACGGVAALAGAGLALWAWRRRSPVLAPPPPPPDVATLAAWQQARDAHRAGDLTDHALAVTLSSLFRDYLEAVLAFPAPARTTREILSYLRHHGLLTDSQRGRARAVLTATDRVKFAREGGGDDFFDALDADLRAVVDATRPRAAPPAEPDDA